MSVSPSNSTTPSLAIGLPPLAALPPNPSQRATTSLPPVEEQELKFGEEALRRFETAEEKLQDAETRRYECEHCAYVLSAAFRVVLRIRAGLVSYPRSVTIDAQRPLRRHSTIRLMHRPLRKTFAKEAALTEHLKSHNQTPVQQTEQLSVKMERWRKSSLEE